MIEPSEIRIMSVECDRVRGINLAQGICDTPTPQVVREAAQRAIGEGMNQYVRLDGIAPLRQAIAHKLETYNGLRVDPEREVLVTSGSTGGFYAAVLALLNPGDEVIVFEPFYSYHVNTFVAHGVQPVFVRTIAPEWQFDMEALRHAVTPRTRAILVNSPANPSGKVFSRAELESIAELCLRHDLFLFTDEIYEYFLYDGREHISPATLPGMRERSITITGFSKTFSVTGWRLGYVACDAKWRQAIAYFHDLMYICAPSPLQMGVTAGLTQLGADFYADLRAEYATKRDLLCDALSAAGLNPSVPQGAYYVLADASALPGADAKQRAMYLLENSGVAAVPAKAFWHDNYGENMLRFCFAKTDADLRSACERLKAMRPVGAAAQ
ncbi:MAG TPA: pyridoxal phosphate-dependent aminotransferase [Terriglobales bacterium]|jgi:aminotransferase